MYHLKGDPLTWCVYCGKEVQDPCERNQYGFCDNYQELVAAMQAARDDPETTDEFDYGDYAEGGDGKVIGGNVTALEV